MYKSNYFNAMGQFKILIMTLLALMIISCNFDWDKQNESYNKSIENTNSKDIQSALQDSIMKCLVNAASRDFHEGNLRMPITFQDVKMGYIITSNKEKHYILSGQYLSQKKNKINDWVPFASINTSDVEHWNGAIATSFYNESQVILDRGEHIASALKRGIWNLNLRERE